MTRSRADLAPGTYHWGDLRDHARAVLEEAGVDNPVTEAGWMIDRVGGGEVRDDEFATARAVGHLVDMLEQRGAGRPLQHVLGRWAFRRLELVVDHRALIPRVETEVVADAALQEAVRLGATPVGSGAPNDEPSLVVADLGTGSGVIALALVDELRDVSVWATDLSADALAVARANLAAVGLLASRVRLAQGSWFEALPDDLIGGIHVVVSNPPYVAEHEFDALPPEIREHEPREALVGGPTGLEAVQQLISGASAWLVTDGALVVELAPHQAVKAAALAERAGFSEVEVLPDLAGRDRVLVARHPRPGGGHE